MRQTAKALTPLSRLRLRRIPSDLGVYFLQQGSPETTGRAIAAHQGRVRKMNGPFWLGLLLAASKDHLCAAETRNFPRSQSSALRAPDASFVSRPDTEQPASAARQWPGARTPPPSKPEYDEALPTTAETHCARAYLGWPHPFISGWRLNTRKCTDSKSATGSGRSNCRSRDFVYDECC